MVFGSVWYDLLSGVSTMIEAVSPWSDSSVKTRKRLAFVRERDPLPCVVVSMGSRRLGDLQFGNTGFWDYEVFVGLFEEGAIVLENAGLREHLTRLHNLQQALHKTTVTGASNVFDVVDFDPSSPFDEGAFDQALDLTVMRVTYRSSETRST